MIESDQGFHMDDNKTIKNNERTLQNSFDPQLDEQTVDKMLASIKQMMIDGEDAAVEDNKILHLTQEMKTFNTKGLLGSIIEKVIREKISEKLDKWMVENSDNIEKIVQRELKLILSNIL